MKKPSTIGERIVLDSIDIVEGMNRGEFKPGLECMYKSVTELKNDLRVRVEERPKNEVTMDFTDEFASFIESYCRKFETPFEYALILFYQCGHTMLYTPDERYPDNALNGLFTVFSHIEGIDDSGCNIRNGFETIRKHNTMFDKNCLRLWVSGTESLTCHLEQLELYL